MSLGNPREGRGPHAPWRVGLRREAEQVLEGCPVHGGAVSMPFKGERPECFQMEGEQPWGPRKEGAPEHGPWGRRRER